MKRNAKFYERKALRRLYNEYSKQWKERFQHGEWVKVNPPYQKGWLRFFDLRDDIKRRRDASRIKKALELVNNTTYCRRKDFTTYNYTKKKRVPIEQTPRFISEEKFLELDPSIQKFLEKRQYTEKTYFGKKIKVGYTLRYDYWVVFVIEPNMVVERWVPDPKWESKMAEITNKIHRDNLWPKMSKEFGWKMNYKEITMTEWLRNKRGELLDQDYILEE